MYHILQRPFALYYAPVFLLWEIPTLFLNIHWYNSFILAYRIHLTIQYSDLQGFWIKMVVVEALFSL
jgi:hypothetical protein